MPPVQKSRSKSIQRIRKDKHGTKAKKKLCLIADDLKKRKGSKPTMVSVKRFGCGWFNRMGLAVSGRHMNNLFEKIFDNEGFSESRFGVPTVVKLESAELKKKLFAFNDYMAQRDKLLPPAFEEADLLLLENNHSSKGVQCFAIQHKWKDGTIMKVPSDEPFLKTACEDGVSVVMLPESVLVDEMPAVEAIMLSGNFHQDTALAQHEIGHIQTCRTVLADIEQSSIPQAVTHFDFTMKILENRNGGQTTYDEDVNAYNFTMITSDAAIDVLFDFHTTVIDPNFVQAAMATFGDLSKVPGSMNRAALGAYHYYACSKKGKGDVVGKKMVANTLKSEVLLKMGSHSKGVLAETDSFLWKVNDTYGVEALKEQLAVSDVVEGISTCFVGVGAFLAKVQASKDDEALKLANPSNEQSPSELSIKLASMEKKLRGHLIEKGLVESELPTEVISEHQRIATWKDKQMSKVGDDKKPQSDDKSHAKPVLLSSRCSFNSEGLELETALSKAAKFFIVLGGYVISKEDIEEKGISAGSCGYVVAVQGSFAVVSFHGIPVAKQVPLESIRAASADEALHAKTEREKKHSLIASSSKEIAKVVGDGVSPEKADTKIAKTEDAADVSMVKKASQVVQWESVSGRDAQYGLSCLASAMLHQAFLAAGVDSTYIEARENENWEDQSIRFFATEDLPKNSLILVPWAAALLATSKPKFPKNAKLNFPSGPMAAEIQIETKGSEAVILFATGQHCAMSDGESAKCISPYWAIRAGTATTANVHEVKLSLSSLGLKGIGAQKLGKSIAESVCRTKSPVVSFPVYVNPNRIRAGSEILADRPSA